MFSKVRSAVAMGWSEGVMRARFQVNEVMVRKLALVSKASVQMTTSRCALASRRTRSAGAPWRMLMAMLG